MNIRGNNIVLGLPSIFGYSENVCFMLLYICSARNCIYVPYLGGIKPSIDWLP